MLFNILSLCFLTSPGVAFSGKGGGSTGDGPSLARYSAYCSGSNFGSCAFRLPFGFGFCFAAGSTGGTLQGTGGGLGRGFRTFVAPVFFPCDDTFLTVETLLGDFDGEVMLLVSTTAADRLLGGSFPVTVTEAFLLTSGESRIVNSEMPSRGEEGRTGTRLRAGGDEAGTMTDDNWSRALRSGAICLGD